MDDRDGAPLRAQEVGSVYDLLEPIAGARLLEVGGGSGLHLGEAVARGAVVWGVDPAAAVLRAARRDAPDADLRLGGPPDLPFDSASFDIVCAFGDIADGPTAGVDRGGPDVVDRALAELFRVCRPGGRLALAGRAVRRLHESEAARHGRSAPGRSASGYPATLLTGVVILER